MNLLKDISISRIKTPEEMYDTESTDDGYQNASSENDKINQISKENQNFSDDLLSRNVDDTNKDSETKKDNKQIPDKNLNLDEEFLNMEIDEKVNNIDDTKTDNNKISEKSLT